MAPPLNVVVDIYLQPTTHLSTREDERLSWPGWLTYNGGLTRQLQVERRTAKELWPETGVLPLSHAGQPR